MRQTLTLYYIEIQMFKNAVQTEAYESLVTQCNVMSLVKPCDHDCANIAKHLAKKIIQLFSEIKPSKHETST